MPMVNFAYTGGFMTRKEAEVLADRVVDVFLSNHIASKYLEELAEVTVCKLTEYDPRDYRINGRPAVKPRYDIELVVPDGSVDGERRDRLVREITEAVLGAENCPYTEEDARRVWIIIRDVQEGRWAVGGVIVTVKYILKHLIKQRLLSKRKASEPVLTDSD